MFKKKNRRKRELVCGIQRHADTVTQFCKSWILESQSTNLKPADVLENKSQWLLWYSMSWAVHWTVEPQTSEGTALSRQWCASNGDPIISRFPTPCSDTTTPVPCSSGLQRLERSIHCVQNPRQWILWDVTANSSHSPAALNPWAQTTLRHTLQGLFISEVKMRLQSLQTISPQ